MLNPLSLFFFSTCWISRVWLWIKMNAKAVTMIRKKANFFIFHLEWTPNKLFCLLNFLSRLNQRIPTRPATRWCRSSRRGRDPFWWTGPGPPRENRPCTRSRWSIRPGFCQFCLSSPSARTGKRSPPSSIRQRSVPINRLNFSIPSSFRKTPFHILLPRNFPDKSRDPDYPNVAIIRIGTKKEKQSYFLTGYTGWTG